MINIDFFWVLHEIPIESVLGSRLKNKSRCNASPAKRAASMTFNMPITSYFNSHDDHPIKVWQWPTQASTTKLHWAHATGFHARVYQPLLEELSEHINIEAWDMRGHGTTEEGLKIEDFTSWDTYYQDLVTYLKQQDEPVWLAGHSVGGMTSLAAATLFPEKVAGVLLVEPVIFDRKVTHMFRLGKLLKQMHKFSLAAGASKRRANFPDHQAAFDNYREKRAFKNWPKEWLSLYVNHGFVQDGEEVTLACRPEWESKSFSVTEHNQYSYIRKLSKQVPVFVLAGESESTFPTKARNYMKKVIPNVEITEVPDSTHFLPMEHPEILRDWILKSMKSR